MKLTIVFLFNLELTISIKLPMLFLNEIWILILMKFKTLFQKTAFYVAVEKGNIEIIRLFLSNEKLDINNMNILISIVL